MFAVLVILAAILGVTVLMAAAARNWDTPKIVRLKRKRCGNYWVFTLEEGDVDEEGQAWFGFMEEEMESA